MTSKSPFPPLGLASLITWAFVLPSLTHAQVVINEIHYDPEPKTEHVEFIELFNAGEEAVDLSGWQFNNGISYTFAEGVTLEPGAYLVITENKTHFDKKFGSLFVAGTPAFDQWEDGTLDNDGEAVALVDDEGELVDRVDYQATFPWPIAANGDGVSMELIHPSLDNDLGGSWRSAMEAPTPHKPNSVFAENAGPQVRQVNHRPKMPTTSEDVVISAKVTDPDNVATVELRYQVVTPGNYIQSLLAKPSNLWRSRPLDPREPNPEFEDPANWQTVEMFDLGEGGDETAEDGIYAVTLPDRHDNRTLVRYRIVATDGAGESVRVPYADDESRNFAYFVYDGVPAYEANQETVHPDGTPYTHPVEVMTSLPVYFLLTDENEFNQCIAYNAGDQVGRDNYDARSAFNWSGTFVYDGVVYDHIKYRLRQRNDRYGGNGKRSMRFRFNRGYHAQFHDHWGNPYPTKWRTLNSGKLNASRGGYNYGINEFINHELWNLVGVPAPRQHWYHFRVIKDRNEVPQGTIFGPNREAQWTGDFFGMFLAIEDYDSRFLDAHNLPDGNLYKLISGRLDGKDVQRVQGKFSVDDGSDYSNILLETRPNKDTEWLNRYINYDHYHRYHAIIEAVRHFDVQPNLAEHLKNRSFYFSPPTEEHPLGLLHTLPWDSETSWGPNWNGGVDYVRQALAADREDRTLLQTGYKNTVREVRDLIWQPDQIDTFLDRIADKLEPFSLAERDRWLGGPREAGSESIPDDIREWVEGMKEYAWEGGSWVGGDGPTTRESKDSGISGREGRDDYLDWLAEDKSAPAKPTLTYTGPEGFPVDGLTFQTTAYSSGTLFTPGEPFAAQEWRLAEVTNPDAPDYDPNEPFLWEWNALWESGPLTEFQDTFTLPAETVRAGRTYRVRVRFTDVVERTSNWSGPIEFLATGPAALTALQEHLRLSEIMYHPAAPSAEEEAAGFRESDFEYVELSNVGEAPLDLRNVRFTKGIDFDFSGSAVETLAPGESVLVVAHLDAFAMRYGGGLPVAGAFGESDEGRLANEGERLKLSYGGGTPIIEFSYDDTDPWPTAADGEGPSLVLASPETPGDLNLGDQWAASAEAGGNPGSLEGGGNGGNPDGDSDQDGMSDAAEALAGTDPHDPLSVLKILHIDREPDAVAVTWTSVSDRSYVLEFSQDLASPSWETVTELDALAGPETTSRDTLPTRIERGSGYYRVRVR